MLKVRKKVQVFEQLHDDSITKAKASAGLLLAAKGLQELVIAPSSSNGPQLPLPVSCLKHDAYTRSCCTETSAPAQSAQLQLWLLHCNMLYVGTYQTLDAGASVRVCITAALWSWYAAVLARRALQQLL